MLGAAIDQLHPEDKIAHRTDAGARRARQARRHHAAHRGTGAKVRRLKRQALPVLGQQRFDFGQRRTGAGGDHQLARLVADDAAVGARIELLALQRHAAMKVLAAPATDTQRRLACSGIAHAVNHVMQNRFHSKPCYANAHGTSWQ